jgi:hypothetical protein
MTRKPTPAEIRALDEVFQKLARDGVIVDSGRKKWSHRTGRYEIIWESRIFGKPEDRKVDERPSDVCGYARSK